MRYPTTRQSTARRAIAILALAAMPLAAAAQNFVLPRDCAQGGATGGTDDSLYANLPPLVQITYNDGRNTIKAYSLTTLDNRWYVEFYVPDIHATYFLVASYTPFLQSYRTVEFSRTGYGSAAQLPLPGSFIDKRTKLWPGITWTVTTTNGGSTPMPGAFVEMSPDIAIPDAPPYTLQADDKGEVTIYCFMSYPAGNTATVFTPDNEYAYDITYQFSESSSSNAVNMRATAAKPNGGNGKK
jgi:hypothetical protein